MPPQLVIKVAGNLDDLKKSLKEGESAVQATSAQMQKLATSFNGDRMIAHAQNVTAAIREVGVTTLTASQASRNLDLLERAMDKMRLTSQEIPASMKATAEQLQFVARSADSAGTSGQNVTAAYRQFDGVLQSMGINLGPQVKAIEDIAGAAGKSAKDVGALGAAGLALGAAYAGWNVGRMIANFFDLDTKIAGATARLMGYGDVAAETAGAKQDVINRAIKNGADATISYTDAIEFNIQAMQKSIGAQATVAAATDTSSAASAQQTETLSATARAWNAAAEAAARATESNVVYGDGIPAIVEKQKTLIEVLDETIAAQARAGAASTAGNATTRPSQGQQTNTTTSSSSSSSVSSNPPNAFDTMRESVQETLNRARGFPNETAQETKDREAREKALREAPIAMDLQPLKGTALKQVIADFREAGDSDQQALTRALKALEAREGTYAPKDNRSYFNMLHEQALLAQLRITPGFANGVRNFGGGMAMVGERGPEMVRLPRGSDVIPNHALGGVTVNTTININGSVLGNKDEIARVVGKSVMDVMRGQGFRAPVGA